ncbi:carboxylating nicotinate-nucleotide diphosphorylase [Candidatus Woesearchaeota archaeon]|jgi:nicotinate-nucleotide pyrophosphorylase (carboxylating)|nr:carboxylating nicotinate-nucleotide diphosphorylase [Candidatus Woesearchaeota archaeon]MBT5272375.1 carboxylating nicotinate-nucleotide diphosphorylase [Candidatus Woesearchaeota archaeon]MBT6336647.1 carboxylating nicotinate-nucleotide diphosphorylase [Candidatus Woesearchaeota archaeon]MBT7927537.1 carboxylating nicotinate-nucleotide diphosphorylase [Candidatus Woesearchaeota archaeon]
MVKKKPKSGKKAVKSKKVSKAKKKVVKKPIKKVIKKKIIKKKTTKSKKTSNKKTSKKKPIKKTEKKTIKKKTSKPKKKTKLKLTPKVDDSIKNSVHLIELAFSEDLGKEGDITSIATIPKSKKVKAQIRVKEHCVLCGIDLAQKSIEVYEKKAKIKPKDRVKFEILMRDGSFLQKNEVVATIEGPAQTILACERIILNFIARLSGISSITNRFVTKLMMHGVQLLDTRKTLGGYRELEKYAVRVGGGTNHRTGLYDMFLIKDNHVHIAGSIKKAVDAAIKVKKTAKEKNIKNAEIELEVESLKQVDELLRLKNLPDIVMLDNLSYEEMEIAVDKIRKKSKLAKKDMKIEASGGIRLENIIEVAKCGVDMISVGSALTLGAKPIDFTVDIID